MLEGASPLIDCKGIDHGRINNTKRALCKARDREVQLYDFDWTKYCGSIINYRPGLFIPSEGCTKVAPTKATWI